MAQHITNFFVRQARKSKHRLESEERLQELLIYNHQTEYTAINDGKLKNFEQCYMFDWKFFYYAIIFNSLLYILIDPNIVTL